jgi:hypothetical protein
MSAVYALFAVLGFLWMLGAIYQEVFLKPRYMAYIERACERLQEEHHEALPSLVEITHTGSPLEGAQELSISLVFSDEAACQQVKETSLDEALQKQLRVLLCEEGFPESCVDAIQIRVVSFGLDTR